MTEFGTEGKSRPEIPGGDVHGVCCVSLRSGLAREGRQFIALPFQRCLYSKTGLLQKALWCTVLSVQFSEKRVFSTVYCLLKTENLDFAKVRLVVLAIDAAHDRAHPRIQCVLHDP